MAAAIMGCGKRQKATLSERLVELDSLIGTAPDSAADLLARFPADSMRDEENRAYHALLLTQARYKAFMPMGEDAIDTINVAIARYADGHDPEKRTRAMLYKGCVMEDVGRLDSAIYHYKAAEDLANKSGDTFNQGYALMRQAWMYHSQYQFEKAILLYKKALQKFGSIQNDKQILLIQCTMANLYNTIDTDSAQLLASNALHLSLKLKKFYYDQCLKALADNSFKTDRYRSCISYAKEAINNTDDKTLSFHCHQLIAQAFAHLDKNDSSEYFMSISPKPCTRQDTMMLMETQSVICASVGDDSHALELRLHIANVADTIVNSKSITALDDALASYANIQFKSEKRIMNSWMIAILSLVLLLIALLAVIRFHENYKAKSLIGILNDKDKEIEEHKTENIQLGIANELMQQQVKEKKCLLDDADKQIELLRHSLEQLKSQGINIMETQSMISNGIQKLLHEIRNQAIAHTRDIAAQTNNAREKKQLMRQYFDDEYNRRLQMLIEAIYPKFKANMDDSLTPLSQDEIMVACMHILKFPGSVISAYMGYTSRFSIAHKKNEIAQKVFGSRGSISKIIE